MFTVVLKQYYTCNCAVGLNISTAIFGKTALLLVCLLIIHYRVLTLPQIRDSKRERHCCPVYRRSQCWQSSGKKGILLLQGTWWHRPSLLLALGRWNVHFVYSFIIYQFYGNLTWTFVHGFCPATWQMCHVCNKLLFYLCCPLAEQW